MAEHIGDRHRLGRYTLATELGKSSKYRDRLGGLCRVGALRLADLCGGSIVRCEVAGKGSTLFAKASVRKAIPSSTLVCLVCAASDESASSKAAHDHATQERLPSTNILLTLYNTQPKALKALLSQGDLRSFDLCERRNNIYTSSLPARFLRNIRFIVPAQLLDDRSERKSDRR